MPVSRFLARTTLCHAVQKGNAVLHNGRLSDDNAAGVADHDTTTKLGGGMDIDTEQLLIS